MTKKKSVVGLRDGTCTATPEEIEAASQERPDLKEYEKNYLCGTCCVGWDTIEEFMFHIDSHEHSFHKERNAARMVPGLGFCGACYCIMQCEMNWNKHITGVKHKKCVASLEAAEALGATKQCPSYIYPLSCHVKGELGPAMPGSSIDCQLANTHGFGHGGAMARNTPIVGMNYITKLQSDEIAASTRQLAGEAKGGVFRCSLCEEDFVFYHRARHMHSTEHQTKYLAAHYPERLEDVKSVKYRVLKLLYHCAQVEQDDIEKATTEAKSLRRLFSAVPKTGHRDALPRADRERVQAEKYKVRHEPSDYPGRRSRGRDYAKRRNMNFDIDSVPYSRAPRSRSPEVPPYRRDGRGGGSRGGGRGGAVHLTHSAVERKPLLSSAARAFLKHSDRAQDNFPHGSQDPYSAEPGYPYTPTGLDNYGVQRSADRYAALGIRHPWEDPSGSAQTAYSMDTYQPPAAASHTPKAEQAMAALAVLEKFAESQAKNDVAQRIDEMKRGVLSGTGIGVDTIAAMAGSLAPSSTAPHPQVGQGRESFDSFTPGSSHKAAPEASNGYPTDARGYPTDARGYPTDARGYPTDARGYPTYANVPVGYGVAKPPPPPSYNNYNTGPQTKFYTKSKSGKEFLPITDALGGGKDYSTMGYNYSSY